jgi:hypothetical protein
MLYRERIKIYLLLFWTTFFLLIAKLFRCHRKHYTQNTTQKTLHRKHYTQNTTQKTLHTKHYTQNTIQKTLHRKHYTQNTTHKTLCFAYRNRNSLQHFSSMTLHRTVNKCNTTDVTSGPGTASSSEVPEIDFIAENTTQKTLHSKHYTENTTHKTLHSKHYTQNTT